MLLSEFEQTTNRWGQEKVPFLFIVDFELQQPIAIPLDSALSCGIRYKVNELTNFNARTPSGRNGKLHFRPIPIVDYSRKFQYVFDHLLRGDSFLTNLTIRTEITTDATMDEIFFMSNARYKLLFNENFLVFSPEIFIQTRRNRIFAYPMKGTIDASIADARKVILNDRKELAEHVTIVDLMRNDLSQVAENVRVERFRYVDEIFTTGKHLLQVSSEIGGDLFEKYRKCPGSLLLALLPAGSVTGAPKPRTLEIIRDAEGEKRGYYTGVFGIYDGENIDSGVMIRFIEKENGKLFYRSGGGITTQSMCETEYQEAIDKIYVPVN